MKKIYPHTKQELTSSSKTPKASCSCCGVGVYLDYAATSPVDPNVLEEMLPYLKDKYGNPSSIHGFGQEARAAIDKAREQVAGFLNCSAAEVIFTGSATESDNIAILGVVLPPLVRGLRPHVITSAIEHPAVLETCKHLQKRGVEVDYCSVNKEGLVEVTALEKLIKENTILVSIMYANNEIGTIQPIAEIGNLIKTINQRTETNNPKPKTKIYFHTDAVQAANYLDCDVQKLGVDLLTLSGHKIYGPKGIGALYIKQGIQLEPIMFGGHHEGGIRPGTENVAAIVGLGAAIEKIKNEKLKIKNLEELRNKLIDGILARIPKSRLNGSREHRLPNNVNVSFEGAEGEAILIALDQEGIAASTGSACSSGSLEPSHVLLALGLSHLQAHGSLRLTLGRYTTEKEIDYILKVLPEVIARLRKISGRV